MRAAAIVLPLIPLCLVASSLAAQDQGATQDSTAQPADLAVPEAVITSNVIDRIPSDALTTVVADAGQIYCWTRVTGAAGEIEISHVWYRGDEEVARIPLRVASADWRTWSAKRIDPNWTGEWRVEIVGPDGTVLKTVSFTVV
ncbi:MAG: DUF2914 domain-containing protein [Gemmatimonadales bacterium]|jgi:hypothetical protein